MSMTITALIHWPECISANRVWLDYNGELARYTVIVIAIQSMAMIHSSQVNLVRVKPYSDGTDTLWPGSWL